MASQRNAAGHLLDICRNLTRSPPDYVPDHTDYEVVNNFVFSPDQQSTAILPHRTLDYPLAQGTQIGGAASLVPAARNILASLEQTIKDLKTAATRPLNGENWDAHQINTDALLQIETALEAASKFVASSTHGCLYPKLVHRINRDSLKNIVRKEAEQGYEPFSAPTLS